MVHEITCKNKYLIYNILITKEDKNMLQIKSVENKNFEDIKHTDENGVEYWLARELYPVLQYKQWRRFVDAINRAKEACQRSKHKISDHFVDIGKLIEMPVGDQFVPRGFADVGKSPKKRYFPNYDYKLTRYACYLTVMNGDPRKEIVALGQTYFAVKTRQQEYQELFNQLTEDDKRLFMRSDVKQKNMLLMDVAKRAGIETAFEHAEFQDFGYMGLYDGLRAKDIAKNKKINDKEEILDYMGSEELGANLFRITQTEAAMKRDRTFTPSDANATHFMVGKEVRGAIERIGGTMPEELPTPEKSTREIETGRIKQIKKPRGGK